MTRLTDRGYFALVALTATTFLYAATFMVPTLGPMLVVLGEWTVLVVTPVAVGVWLVKRA